MYKLELKLTKTRDYYLYNIYLVLTLQFNFLPTEKSFQLHRIERNPSFLQFFPSF